MQAGDPGQASNAPARGLTGELVARQACLPEVQYMALRSYKRKFLLQLSKTQLFSTASDMEQDAGLAFAML